MIRLFLVCVLLATSLAVDSQTSKLKIIKQWSNGMTAEVCVHHNYTIDCGWDMRLEFSGPLRHFDMKGAKTKSRGGLFKSDTKPFVIVGNRERNKVQTSVACHRFDAYFTSPVNVSAIYSRICTEGRWTDIIKTNESYECTHSNADKLKSMTDSNSSIQDGTAPQQCNAATCSRGELTLTSLQSWGGGMKGKICVSYGVLVTCIFDIELTFSGSIKALNVDGMRVSDVSVQGHEFLYKLTLERHGSIQANKTKCHSFTAYHAPRTDMTNVTSRYLDGCHSVNVAVSEMTSASVGTLTPRITTLQMTRPPDMISTDSFDFNNTFLVIDQASWRTGRAGWICMDCNFPLTCRNVVEISFSPPVLSLQTTKMTILQENHTDDESLFTLRSRIHSTSSHWNTRCFWFSVRHISRQYLTNITSVNVSQCDDATTEMTTHTTVPTEATTTESPSTTSQTTVNPGGRFFNYTESLTKSMIFYLNQRAGNINDYSWRRQYPHKPTLTEDGRDLSGGLYESTDFVKFNFPIAATTTTLLWGFLQWADAYKMAGQLDDMYQLMKHSLDYLMRCWDNDKQILYTQIGVRGDSPTWSQLETVNLTHLKTASLNHKVQYVNDSRTARSDIAGEMAAALAAGSLVFKEKNSAYASELLKTAKQVYAYAEKHRSFYQEDNYEDLKYFPSDGFTDELCWGAAWLLRATDDETYLSQAKTAAAKLTRNELKFYSWNYKGIGCYLLMHNYQNIAKEDKQRYREKIETFLKETNTACGLDYHHDIGPLRYAANVAMIALMAADSEINPEPYRERAEKQIKYMLGANNNDISYQIGFGPNFPRVPQFLGVMCTNKSAVCKVDKMPYIGALVSGPDANDEYYDNQDRISTDDVAIDFNAGFQSTLAGLIHLQLINKLPNATPKCSETD